MFTRTMPKPNVHGHHYFKGVLHLTSLVCHNSSDKETNMTEYVIIDILFS